MLRATTACTFSYLICPDVSAPAALASLLFDPPEPQNTGKTQCFATSLPFRAAASSLFWLSPSLIFPLLTFYTSEFLSGSASSWLCCFSSVDFVGTLVSKLPSIIVATYIYLHLLTLPLHCQWQLEIKQFSSGILCTSFHGIPRAACSSSGPFQGDQGSQESQ